MVSDALLNKKIVLGVTGSIAAYKSADLVRRLKEAGAEVRVVMTQSACEFITPLTMQTLSGFPVATDLLDAVQESTMGHITLARWADWVLIAPASANTIANLAYGQSDDLLSALCLATESPVAIAPAMNNKMWQNAATQSNLECVSTRGVYIIGPASGDQACGEQGEGRLLEPNDIVMELSQLAVPARLQDKHIVVTAGPTYEPIDPVRFIGNRSSGKMGFAIAAAAAEAGAKVTLISGPVALMTPPSVTRVDVETAEQMYDAAMTYASNSDIFIGCAAVADYRPEHYQDSKLKKADSSQLQLNLTINKDIVSAVAALQNRSFVVGFAAETSNVEQYDCC
jgi:phosphopantothenoylcysteine decarboxylase/phosphopantothenate--cysteine ligase